MPFIHVPQVPARQNMVDPIVAPQFLPSTTNVPMSVQTGDPLPHVTVPVWHLLTGMQDIPIVHATQALAPLHTKFVPHELPGALLMMLSTQTDDPVEQDVVPTLQGLGLDVHPKRSGVQEVQSPPLQ